MSIAGNVEENAILGINPSSEEYFPTVAIHALVKILRDTSLHVHHTAVVQAIIYTFKALGLKSVSFLPQVYTHTISLNTMRLFLRFLQ